MVDGCPDEADVLEFVEGRLEPADEARLRAHVDACAACRELVASLADVWLDAPGTADAPVSPEHLLRGALIGRYTVLAREGAGGMGAVYSAYDPELDRKVAIKLVRTDLSARRDPDELRTRMAREAKAMARIHHPNVIAVYDVGTIGDELFIAMEFVEGTTLGAWTKACPRSWREVLGRYLRAGEGLAAAHRAGLVHRDFKPDNVLVGTDGERVCVGDFGLVRMQAVAREREVAVPVGHTDRLSTATFVGTPAYMAPEQRDGEHVDARADQFSFCRALEEALFSEPGSTAPAWLRAPLERGQRTRPDERWPSMDELLHALRRDPSRTRRRWATGVGVGALACLAVIGTWRSTRANEPACPDPIDALAGIWDEAVRERIRVAFATSDLGHARDTHARVDAALDHYGAAWAAMRRDACEATNVRAEQSAEMMDLRMACLARARSKLAAMTELLVEPSTTDVDQAVLAVGALPDLGECADADALRATVPLPDDLAARESIEWLFTEIDRIRARQQMLGDAPAELERLRPLVEETERLDYAPLRFTALSLLSDLQDLSGDSSAAEISILAALDAASAARDDRSVGIALVKLVALLGVGQRRFAEAKMAGRLAEATLAGPHSTDEDRAGLYSALGLLARLEGRYADAKDLHARALQLIDADPNTSQAARAAERSNFAATLIAMGEHTEARALLEQAIAMLQADLGDQHPILGYVRMNLGLGQAEQGNYAAAQREYEAAVGIWEAAYGPDHRMIADCLDNMSVAALGDGRVADARRYSERAIDIFTRTVGPDHPELGDAILNYAGVLRDEGQTSRAAAEYERALAIHEKSLGPDHADLAYDLTGLGDCRIDEGRIDEAIALLERALALREASEGDPKLVARTRAVLERARAARDHGTAKSTSRMRSSRGGP